MTNETQSQWISLEERLPHDNVTIIVTDGYNSITAIYHDGKFYKEGAWMELLSIKFWQPLPEPPI
jgi:hypothetical protein